MTFSLFCKPIAVFLIRRAKTSLSDKNQGRVSSILDEVLAKLRHEIEEKGATTDNLIREHIKASVYERHSLLQSHEQVGSIDGTALSASKVGDLRKSYRPFVDRIKKEVFQELPIESAVSRKLNEIAVYIFTKQAFHQRTAGVVVAGYGTEDFFPTVEEFRVEGGFSRHAQVFSSTVIGCWGKT